MPSLILQPLVENAVKHGVDKIAGPGRIRIRARREGARLVMTVSDNGPGPAKISKLDEVGVGLANIRQRLEQLYGSEQALTLADAPEGGGGEGGGGGGGTVAQIVIPFRTRAELRTTLVASEGNG